MATVKIIQAWHNRLHSIISTLDHSSAATPGRILEADANGLPIEATNTDPEVADAVVKSHTQGTDTTLGTLTADINFAHYKAIAMACDNGTTMPTSPVSGQWFLHSPTSRSILYQYKGAWIPHISMGSMTVYVDNTDGTDSLDKGYAVDANAFKTVQYAVNAIPPIFGGNVIIYVNDENTGENVVIRGKLPSANYTIKVIGTKTTLKSGTVGVGSVSGTGATQGTVVDDTGGMGVNAYANKIIYDATNAAYRIVDSNTADTFTIVGTWATAPTNGNSYTVYDWGTILGTISIMDMQAAVEIQYVYFTKVDTYYGSSVTLTFCSLVSTTYNVLRARLITNACYLANSAGVPFFLDDNAKLTFSQTKICGSHTSTVIIDIYNCGSAFFTRGTIIDGYVDGANKANIGVRCKSNGTGDFSSASADGYCRVRNCDTGLYAYMGAMIVTTSNNQYSGNTADETAVAASFGYID